MADIKIFENPTFGSVRSVEVNGEPWFAGKDVAEILGYSNPQKAVRDHVDEEDKTLNDSFTVNGTKLVLINESGLYSLILKSNLPTAKEFKRWVTSEVLPSIRKSGGYLAGQETMSDSDLMAKALVVAQRQLEMRNIQIDLLTAENRRMEPLANFAEAVSVTHDAVPVGTFAKMLAGGAGLDIGQNRLFEILRNEGWLCRRKGRHFNMPTQESIDRKLFTVKERISTDSDGSVRMVRTPLLTGKGQLFFFQRLTARKDRQLEGQTTIEEVNNDAEK